MASDGFLAEGIVVLRARRVELAARCVFAALLAAAPFLPMMGSSIFDYPAVSDWWVCLPFGALFLLALADLRRPLRLHNLDLLALVSFVFALGAYGSSRSLAMWLLYPPLVYLAARMLFVARVGRGDAAHERRRAVRPVLSGRWLLVGVIVLTAVHVHWALGDPSTSDVGSAGAWGASRIVHGQALYGPDHALSAKLGEDPHYDTYGPFDYETYVPFVLVSSATTAARLLSLLSSLLAALLLFLLGRRLKDTPLGLALALAWLAYPFTLYSDGFDFNDALLAATLVGALLVAGSPLRRGAMTALAGWTKLSPLALVPLMLAHTSSARESRSRAMARFAAGFLLASAVIFVPALDHSTPATFVSRTLGFQAGRSPAFSIWALYGDSFHQPAWVVTASKVVHGLLLAVTVAMALALPRLPRRQDLVGLAAAGAAILIALQAGDGYYSFSYLLWFAPLVLVAIACDGETTQLEIPAEARSGPRRAPARRARPIAGHQRVRLER